MGRGPAAPRCVHADTPSPGLSPASAEPPMLPSSLMLLNTAHEYLGRRAWCCNSDGALLRFYVSAAPRPPSALIWNVRARPVWLSALSASLSLTLKLVDSVSLVIIDSFRLKSEFIHSKVSSVFRSRVHVSMKLFRRLLRILQPLQCPSPLQCSCLENPRDRGAWWAAVYESHRVRPD